MTNVTIKSFAEQMQIPIKRLIQKFADAGIKKTPLDAISIEEKKILLAYINRNHHIFKKKLSLKKKTHSTLNIAKVGGQNKLIHIEIRKKKYLKCDISLVSKNKSNEINDLNYLENKSTFDKDSKNKIKKTNLNQKNILQKINRYQEENNKIELNQIKNLSSKNDISSDCININTQKLKFIEEPKKEKNTNIQSNQSDIFKETYENKINKKNSLKNKIIKKEKNKYLENFYLTEDENKKYVKKRQNNRFQIEKSIENIKIAESKVKNKKQKSKLSHKFSKPTKKFIRNITIRKNISIIELANKMAVKSSRIIDNMKKLGIFHTINTIIDQDTAQLIIEDMGHKAKLIRENALEESILSEANVSQPQLYPRAPIVTIMGHVDHGKTSLLDYIRKSTISLKEIGGITQHIGAYLVKTKHGNITFLDTPGHAAFTAMRARGAQITDIVVLVVAADDSVMPQTIEAIQHAKHAQVPIIIAINKIDKNVADPLKVKKELMQHGILPEEFGGENQCILVSAKSGKGIDSLLESILLQAEILELKANHTGIAHGVVIESRLDKGKGPIATILIHEGKLNRGDTVLCGCEYGRIRAIRDSYGNNIISVGPSIPVEILGLSGVPIAGDKTTVVKNEKKAREIAIYRQNKLRENKLKNNKIKYTQNSFFNLNVSNKKFFNFILKSDVQGTAQAISDTLNHLSSDKVEIKIIGLGVGSITETDVVLAKASNATLLGFNVRADVLAVKIIEAENLKIKLFSIIYDLINYVKNEINLEYSPISCKKINGILEVKHIFHLPKSGMIAGCIVKTGTIKKNDKVKILRNNTMIYKSEICSLRRFKEDVNEVKYGMECGIGIKNFNSFKILDIIEVLEK